MPKKPFDQLSLAYQKRILSAEKRGLSRSQARGHAKATELPASFKPGKSDRWIYNTILNAIKNGANKTEEGEMIKQYKKLLKHKEKTSAGTSEEKLAAKIHERDIAKSIRVIADSYETGEDLQFVVEGWY